MEVDLRDYDAEQTRIPIRDGFHYTEPTVGLIEWMPLLQLGHMATIKIVGYHPNNPTDRNMPTILSTIGQFDARTGHLIGIVDGTFVTALRTGAASALASNVLASPQSKTLGLIGAGAQAVTQYHALSRSFEFDDVLIFDTDPGVSATFSDRVRGLSAHEPRISLARATE